MSPLRRQEALGPRVRRALLRPLVVLALLFALAAAAYAQEPTRRLAVLEFEPVGVREELALNAQRSVERVLYGIPDLVLIERDRIDLLIQEQELQLSDLTDQETAVQVGRILAASTVVTGTVYNPRSPRLSVRALDVETGTVLYVDDFSVTRDGRVSGAARGLTRSIEKTLFPERFEPVAAEVGGGAFAGPPLSELTTLIATGGGVYASANLENIVLNHLVFGARIGLSYMPGSDANTQRLLYIPATVSAGYRGYRRSAWTFKGGGELDLLLESGGPKILVLFHAGLSRRLLGTGR